MTTKKKGKRTKGPSKAERSTALAWALERLAGATDSLAEAIGFIAIEIGELRSKG